MNIISNIKTDKYELKYGVIKGGSKTFVMLPGVSLVSVLNNIDGIEDAYNTLLDDYTIYVFDHATPTDCDFNMDDLVNSILFAIDKLNLKDIYLYGVSLGGLIASKITIKRPELIKKMILVASCIKTNDKRLLKIKQWEKMSNKYMVQELNKDFFTTMFTKEFVEKNKNGLESFINNGSKQDCDSFSIVLRTMYDFDITKEIKEIKIPTYVFASDLDPIFGLEASMETVNLLNCDYYIYKGYSHAFYDEAPDFKQRIKDWFNNEIN